MNVRMALAVLTSSLLACGGRTHEQQEGCYALTPVRPSGIIRDECQLLADAAANLVEMDFRFSSPSLGELLTVSMAGQFSYNEEAFSADGTATNSLLPIGGQTCQLQLVDVHLDATTRTSTSFTGVIRISTTTPRPETCICQAWFEYEAGLTTNESLCP